MYAKSAYSWKQVFLPEKEFWRKVFGFAIPVSLQNLSVSLFGILDVSIISNMGETAVSAVSLANEVFYISSNLTFGITSGASIFLSRYYGAKNQQEFRKIFSIMMFLSTMANAIVMMLSILAPKGVLSLYTNDPVLIESGALYLFITASMNVCYGIANSISTFFRSVKKPSIPLLVSLATVVIKTVLNVVLIYGLGPIPGMGIAGAALASLLSNIASMLLYIVFLYRFEEKQYCFKLQDIRLVNGKGLGVFLKDTTPIIINETMWAFGLSSFSMIFGRMGLTAVSALSVARKLEALCNSFFYGIGIGACVVISSMIGEKKYEEAKLAGRRYAVVGFEFGVGIMLLMLGCNHFYVDTFFKELTPETCAVAKSLIMVYALYMPFRSLASAMIMGSLRAGGDGKHAMYYDVLPTYIWSLPVGFLLGIVLELPIVVVLAAMQFKRVIKSVFALWRLLSDKWMKI